MHTGAQITFLHGNDAPLKSELTLLVAAAIGAGYRFGTKKPLLWTVEEIDGKLVEEVKWAMNANVEAVFRMPNGTDEKVSFAEFVKRFRSQEWVETHPDHPISHMRAMAFHFQSFRNDLRAMKPLVKLRKGKRFAFIPADASEADKARIMELYEKGI